MADQTVETVTQQNQETVTKQKNPLRIEQGRKLVEYNKRKKEELKHLNDQITKQDRMTDHKLNQIRILMYMQEVLAYLDWQSAGTFSITNLRNQNEN